MFKQSILAGVVTLILLPLSGCDQKTATAVLPAASASAPTQTAPQVYTPLSADQLYQLVSPIALFPDKLLAQVLAGAGYPDQISAADNWLAQNRGLQPAALSNAANNQPWDSSIRSLVLFPDVIDQMAKNIAWTTQLGTAYLNDPTDVMNAIQVMRQRASHKGTLKNTPQQRVVVSSVPPDYVDPQAVVMAPPQTIVIEPSQPDVLYVPYYDPWVAYGEPVPVYPGYHYSAPAGYSGGEMLAAGIISFGAGIALGELIDDHHHHGWNDWNVHWDRHYDGRHQPVIYNNEPYISHSTTVVEHINNVNEYNNINRYNTDNHYDGPNRHTLPTMTAPNAPAMPHFAPSATAQPSPGIAAFSPAHVAPTAPDMRHPQGTMTMPNFHAAQFAHPPIPVENHHTQPSPAAIHPTTTVNHPVRQSPAPENPAAFSAHPVEHAAIAPHVQQKSPEPMFHQAPAPLPEHHVNNVKRPPEHFPVKKEEHKVG
ncbi:uncharacterized protein DUF3300 [Serratia fonticola]|uniref:Uncharacterized protein DUF3300 n=1 Tax=Serratia fonticola TaxID=47917 RepID=A0A542BMW7_SERFO|nr:DUF3300 domain-containing protein [Serratia fonticola]TQI79885.1 uncharacterized protein DUF3300 [Serratia fonticola]TQI98090.1 uncharacterized protein DUF3300 [Serratia fonticola]TVZ67618.1 uncharacterized protein DUF3300 [Serratia fonticola]